MTAELREQLSSLPPSLTRRIKLIEDGSWVVMYAKPSSPVPGIAFGVGCLMLGWLALKYAIFLFAFFWIALSAVCLAGGLSMILSGPRWEHCRINAASQVLTIRRWLRKPFIIDFSCIRLILCARSSARDTYEDDVRIVTVEGRMFDFPLPGRDMAQLLGILCDKPALFYDMAGWGRLGVEWNFMRGRFDERIVQRGEPISGWS